MKYFFKNLTTKELGEKIIAVGSIMGQEEIEEEFVNHYKMVFQS